MVGPAQEGSWKWILSIILFSVSWLVAGMVSWCSCLSESASQNPGLVSECVDVKAQCHLGNMDWRDDGNNSPEFGWTGRRSYSLLWWRHQTPVLKMNGFQFCAPSPLVSYVWSRKCVNRGVFSLWFHLHMHKATWLWAINSLWCNAAFISCHPGPVLPPAKCQMLVTFAFGR